jgi:hypothetical protein
MTKTPSTAVPRPLRSRLLRSLFTAFALLVLAMGGMGCDSGGSDGDDTPTAEARFLHAAADAGPITVVADGNELVSDLSFRRDFANPSITEYQDVPASASVEIQDGGGTVVASVGAGQLQAGTKYTVVVAGSPAEGGNAPQAVLLSDERPTLGSDEVGLRLVHGAVADSSIDVYQVPPGDSLSASNRIASGVTFGETVPASGDFSVRTVPDSGFAWTVPTAAGPVQFPVGIPGEASLSTGRFATAIALDTEQGAGFPVAGIVQVD